MKSIATVLGLLLLPGVAPASALASSGQSNAVVALHAQAHNLKGVSCGSLDPSLPCSQFTTIWPVGRGADVYVVVARADGLLGISGLSCGIAYDPAPGSGVDVFGTTVCSDLDYPNTGPNGEWPASHGGNRFIWVRTDNCQRVGRPPDGVHAVACGFYVYAYSEDVFSVIQNENLQFGPEFLVVDCPGPANWNLPYPSHAGSIGFGQGGGNPCSGPFDGDTTPPVLQSASGTAGLPSVTLQFSEPMAYGADTESNYVVYPTSDPAAVLAVTHASLATSNVTLTLGENLQELTSYSVEVTGILDRGGNPVAAGSTVIFATGPLDTTPPVLVSAYGTPGLTTVSVYFSETVSAGATTPSNYSVYPSDDPGAAIAVLSASRSGSKATLTLASFLAYATAYTVEVSNVADLVGNEIAPGSTVSLTTDAHDSTPPTLVSASGIAGTPTVTVEFSEAVGSGSNTASNYEVYPTLNSSGWIQVVSASSSGSTATLTLASNLIHVVTGYTVRVSNVADLAGNLIVPTSVVDFYPGTAGSGSLTLANAWGVRNSSTVWVTFSEEPGSGGDVTANYRVFPSADSSAAIPVRSAALSSATAALTLDANLAPDTEYTVAVSGVQDLSGDVIAPGSSASFKVNGSNGQGNAVVAVHAQAHNTKGVSCGDLSPLLSCGDFRTSWPLRSGADVFLVVADADPILGVSGVSLGIQYANPGSATDGVGVDVFGYVSCADYEYPTSPDGITDHAFPASGGGNRLFWDREGDCQRTERGYWGVHAVACAFYVYAYGHDQFTVDQNRTLPTGPEFMVMDCSGPALTDLQWPARAGYIDFGGNSGYNPCMAVTPVVRTTWGKLKNQYH